MKEGVDDDYRRKISSNSDNSNSTSEDLDSNSNSSFQNKNNFLFAVHPHGVFALTALLALATNGGGLDEDTAFKHIAKSKDTHTTDTKLKTTESAPTKTNPKSTLRFAVADFPFLVPIYRDYALRTGAISLNKKAIRNNLENNQSVGIVVGGADESLLAGSADGVLRLILKGRKGFLKIALEQDVDVIPVMNFGEHRLYKQVFNEKLRKYWQLPQCRMLGWTMPMIYKDEWWKIWGVKNVTKEGPRIKNKNVETTKKKEVTVTVTKEEPEPDPDSNPGFFSSLVPDIPTLAPSRVKLTCVLGKPLDVSKFVPEKYHTKNKSRRFDWFFIPKQEQNDILDRIHEAYVDNLKELHAKYWPKYGSWEEKTLKIVSSEEARSMEIVKEVIKGREKRRMEIEQSGRKKVGDDMIMIRAKL